MKGRYNDKNIGIEVSIKNERYSFTMDALSEMGNIAAAHAATALSKMLGNDIMIDVPESHLYRVEDIPQNISHIADEVAVVQIDVSSEERGIILFVFPSDKAIRLSDMFLRKDITEKREINEDDKSVICEIGNICACAYLNAISKFLDVTLIPSPPGLAIDIPQAIFQYPASVIGSRSEYAIVIETKFTQGKETFPGMILFILDKDSQRLFLEKIRAKTNMKAC